MVALISQNMVLVLHVKMDVIMDVLGLEETIMTNVKVVAINDSDFVVRNDLISNEMVVEEHDLINTINDVN